MTQPRPRRPRRSTASPATAAVRATLANHRLANSWQPGMEWDPTRWNATTRTPGAYVWPHELTWRPAPPPAEVESDRHVLDLDEVAAAVAARKAATHG